jgi:hypothetical protein
VEISFYEELELMFDKFPKHHMNILLENSIANANREDFFKPIIGNEGLFEINNENALKFCHN